MPRSVTRRDADYEMTVDGIHAGLAEFVENDGVVVFTHTEIDEKFGGRGLGGELARAALDDVRARGGKVVPECAFIKAWIGKNPNYADLVQSTSRTELS